MERVYQRLEHILTRIDNIDERVNNRMDALDGRLAEVRDQSLSRENEMMRQMSHLREGVEKDIGEIKRDLESVSSSSASQAAEGAAAGAARGVAESQIGPQIVRQTLSQAAKSPFAIFIGLVGAFTAIVTAATAFPKVWRFFADVGPAIAYWLGGPV